MATSTLVRPVISQPSHLCIPTSFQAIALHTFIMAWFSKGFHALKTAWIVVALPWTFSFLYFLGLGVAHRSGSDMIFRPAPVCKISLCRRLRPFNAFLWQYWCWIGKYYFVERIFGVYFWMWSSFLISMLLYLPLSLWVRGNITIGNRFWRFRVHKRQQMDDPRGMRRHAMNLLAYV